MKSGLSDLMTIGIPAILFGMLALGMMVHRELGPFVGLTPEGKWLLTVALGMGILAFVLKLGVAQLLVQSPENTIDRLTHTDFLHQARADSDKGDFLNPAPNRPRQYVWATLPTTAPEPADNPGTLAKIALGKHLFNEKQLSGDASLSCASCHDLYEKAGSDARRTAIGIANQVGARNVPTIWNAAFQSVLFWDGRVPSLEAQAKGPILNPIEMGMSTPAEAERRLNADPTYRARFALAFGEGQAITFERIVQAIAAYERTLITADTPYDRYVRGESTALNQAQLRGMALFEAVGCVLCHRGPNFSDASLLDGETPLRFFPANPTPYDEKYKLLTESGERGVWRVPSLRNVALTGPWLHNGSVDKLDEVVRIMASAQLGRSTQLMTWLNKDSALDKVDRSPLSDRDIHDIVAFLESLSSDGLRKKMAPTTP
ncbi:cytochrome-c peroxidase [Dechloromonas sp. ARDL1]|uniref:cytochrome-c peroxidase n=1 Tax=Dechloromonas sp. ARDL1 TaxID=3322121 RepID=UPI003DA7A266